MQSCVQTHQNSTWVIFFQGSSSTESRASYRFFYTSFHVRSLFGWLRVIDSALTKKGFHSKLEMSHITQDSLGISYSTYRVQYTVQQYSKKVKPVKPSGHGKKHHHLINWLYEGVIKSKLHFSQNWPICCRWWFSSASMVFFRRYLYLLGKWTTIDHSQNLTYTANQLRYWSMHKSHIWDHSNY